MSDRDDGGFNFPEGKGMSDEGQRRKAALKQLTVSFFILHTHTHTHTQTHAFCTRKHSHTNKTFYFFLDQQAESSHSAWTYAYGLIKVIIQLVDHSCQGIIRNNSSSCLAHF